MQGIVPATALAGEADSVLPYLTAAEVLALAPGLQYDALFAVTLDELLWSGKLHESDEPKRLYPLRSSGRVLPSWARPPWTSLASLLEEPVIDPGRVCELLINSFGDDAQCVTPEVPTGWPRRWFEVAVSEPLVQLGLAHVQPFDEWADGWALDARARKFWEESLPHPTRFRRTPAGDSVLDRYAALKRMWKPGPTEAAGVTLPAERDPSYSTAGYLAHWRRRRKVWTRLFQSDDKPWDAN